MSVADRSGLARTRAATSAGAVCLLGGLAIATGGCVSAGLAAVGPVIAAVQAVADRTVDRTYSADLGTADRATVDALTRMGVRIENTDRSTEPWTIEGKGETVTFHAKLTRVAGQLTRVSLRAENGGFSADKKTAEEMLNQIAISLAPVPAPASASAAGQAASAEAIASLKREVDRLGSKLESLDRSPGALAQPASATFTTGGIMVIPASAGVPSAPTPEGMKLPALAETLEGWRDAMPVGSNAGSPRASGPIVSTPGAEGPATPLTPVESLIPVGALAGEGKAK